MLSKAFVLLMKNYFYRGWVHTMAWTISLNNIVTLEQKMFVPLVRKLLKSSEPTGIPFKYEIKNSHIKSQTVMFVGGWCLPCYSFYPALEHLDSYKVIIVHPPAEAVSSDPNLSRSNTIQTSNKLLALAREHNVTNVIGYSLGSAFALHVANNLPKQINCIWLLQTGETITRGMWESDFAQKVKSSARAAGFQQDDYSKAYSGYEPKQNLDQILPTTTLYIDYGLLDSMIHNAADQIGSLLGTMRKFGIKPIVTQHSKLGHYGMMDQMDRFISARLCNDK